MRRGTITGTTGHVVLGVAASESPLFMLVGARRERDSSSRNVDKAKRRYRLARGSGKEVVVGNREPEAREEGV